VRRVPRASGKAVWTWPPVVAVDACAMQIQSWEGATLSRAETVLQGSTHDTVCAEIGSRAKKYRKECGRRRWKKAKRCGAPRRTQSTHQCPASAFDSVGGGSRLSGLDPRTVEQKAADND
jgi:hypothetical protein